MSDCGEKTIRIGREINTFNTLLQIQDSANESGILMTETIMFLPRPSARLDIIQTANIFTPGSLITHLDEFGILNHHGMNDSKERFIRRKDASPSCQSVSFHQFRFRGGYLGAFPDRYVH
jgi:hypothetical protein